MPTGTSTQKVIKIDDKLWDDLDSWLKTPEAEILGYHSKAQFATEAVREHLRKIKYEPLLRELKSVYSDKEGFDPLFLNALEQFSTKNKKSQSLRNALKKL